MTVYFWWSTRYYFKTKVGIQVLMCHILKGLNFIWSAVSPINWMFYVMRYVSQGYIWRITFFDFLYRDKKSDQIRSGIIILFQRKGKDTYFAGFCCSFLIPLTRKKIEGFLQFFVKAEFSATNHYVKTVVVCFWCSVIFGHF